MNLNEMINNELLKIHQLYMNDLNNNPDIDNVIDTIQSQIYTINNIRSQLIKSLEKLKNIKQSTCSHTFIHDNINYEPMQIVCTKCNKLFY